MTETGTPAEVTFLPALIRIRMETPSSAKDTETGRNEDNNALGQQKVAKFIHVKPYL